MSDTETIHKEAFEGAVRATPEGGAYTAHVVDKYGFPAAQTGLAVSDPTDLKHISVNPRTKIGLGPAPDLPPGYKYGQLGTTIYRPKPEDPEQEAIHGKKTYKVKYAEDSPQKLRERQTALEQELKEQKDKVNLLLYALAKEQKTERADNEDVPVSNNFDTEDVPVSDNEDVPVSVAKKSTARRKPARRKKQ